MTNAESSMPQALVNRLAHGNNDLAGDRRDSVDRLGLGRSHRVHRRTSPRFPALGLVGTLLVWRSSQHPHQQCFRQK